MKKYAKYFLSLLITGVLLIGTLISVCADPETIIVSHEASINIYYLDKEDNIYISNAHFRLYRVASIDEEGKLTLTDDFKDSHVIINDISVDDYKDLAPTLRGYVNLNGTKSVSDGYTKEDGTLLFDKLKTGMYLLVGDKAICGDYIYTPTPAIIVLPTYQMYTYTYTWNYDLTISPKYVRDLYAQPGETTTVCVQKVWHDAGHETDRPSSVEVALLGDGALVETKTLNSSCNWRYIWDDLDASVDWEVAEVNVPAGYSMVCQQNYNDFVIVNSLEITPTPGPGPDDETTGPDETGPVETLPPGENTSPQDTTPRPSPVGQITEEGGGGRKSTDTIPPNPNPNDNPNSNGGRGGIILPQTGFKWMRTIMIILIGLALVVSGIIVLKTAKSEPERIEKISQDKTDSQEK